jgi:hypothetical protein
MMDMAAGASVLVVISFISTSYFLIRYVVGKIKKFDLSKTKTNLKRSSLVFVTASIIFGQVAPNKNDNGADTSNTRPAQAGVTANQPKVPLDQRSQAQQMLETELETYRDQYYDTRRSNNQVALDALLTKFVDWKDNFSTNRALMENYTCSISEIQSKDRITCRSNFATYILSLRSPDLEILSKLKQSDKIKFTGFANYEISTRRSLNVTSPIMLISDVEINRL